LPWRMAKSSALIFQPRRYLDKAIKHISW